MANINTEKATGSKTPSEPSLLLEKEVTKDDGLRTVLLGWGKVAPTYHQYVDHYVFIGGVCRDVLQEDADSMSLKRHPKTDSEGEPRDKAHQVKHGHFKCHVLPSDATESDFVKATGIQPMPIRKLATMLNAYSPDELRAAMGDEKTRQFAKALLATFGKE